MNALSLYIPFTPSINPRLSGLATVLALGMVLGGGLLPVGAQAEEAAGEPVQEQPQQQEQVVQTVAVDEVDPWQGFNRRMFAFNDVTDRYLLRPLAIGYKTIMPDPLERGVSNIFNNVMEVPSIINGSLQGNFSGAAYYSGRLLVNTTLGLGGLLDVAQHMNLPARDREDFGQTLAVWGVNAGPYVVLPFLGPSTVRDGFARPVDWYADPTTYIDHVRTENTVLGVSILNTRASLLELEKNLTGDKYTFIRDAYLQRREYLIHNGEIEDSFGTGESFEFEDFDSEEF
ncbi:MlaA family lipoprotein [Cellvibrio japonicus]|uniref:VacJ lipoprotein n=1 Tax=Cellvibrio japonicus (strain Ueda107) TaxID=498211 RepID=B3PJZ7_CELJU|nr:VacJ family lipoprotein [Cellvibrio japonicus]ACE84920.1 vacJ lipoprotein [Cellvibrio japonicus Ueda107]